MNIIESYIILFVDTFFSNFLVSARTDVALHVMRIFEVYNIYLICIISICAMIFASCANYLFGMILYKIYRSLGNEDLEMRNRYKRLGIFFNSFGRYVLLFVALPSVGKFIALVSGFIRYGILETIFICIVSECMYLAYIFLT